MKASELIAKASKLTEKQLLDEIAKLDMHEKDLLVECKVCDAAEGEECTQVYRKKQFCQQCFKLFHECECRAGPYVKKGKALVSLRVEDRSKIIKPGVVHIGRRIRRLLAGIR